MIGSKCLFKYLSKDEIMEKKSLIAGIWEECGIVKKHHNIRCYYCKCSPSQKHKVDCKTQNREPDTGCGGFLPDTGGEGENGT